MVGEKILRKQAGDGVREVHAWVATGSGVHSGGSVSGRQIICAAEEWLESCGSIRDGRKPLKNYASLDETTILQLAGGF